jgi:peptidyl-prolyl cis-trans isomerase C
MRFAATVSMIALLTCAMPAMAADYVMMKVNGQEISSADAKKFWEGLFPAGEAPAFDGVKPDVRDKVLRGMMAEKLILAEATAKGVDKSDAVVKQLEDMKKKLVVKSFLDSKTAEMITDADLKKQYDAIVAVNKDEREVRARHILVPTEAEAKDVRKKLDEGKKFEDVAKDFSKDPGSAKNGGDLGYFTKDKMVKPFADAAFAMKKGEISQPVKSDFGWHVIKVEDSRAVKPPAFAEVKEQIRNKLQQEKLNEYVGGLVNAAEVKVFDAKGKEVAFEKNLLVPVAAPTPAAAEAKPAAKKAN